MQLFENAPLPHWNFEAAGRFSPCTYTCTLYNIYDRHAHLQTVSTLGPCIEIQARGKVMLYLPVYQDSCHGRCLIDRLIERKRMHRRRVQFISFLVSSFHATIINLWMRVADYGVRDCSFEVVSWQQLRNLSCSSDSLRFVITAFLFYSSSAYSGRQIAREYVRPTQLKCFCRLLLKGWCSDST